jgi:hypothetical protein
MHSSFLCNCFLLRSKCNGTRAETWFRLSAKRTSPFKSAGASVQSTTRSRGVLISGSNAGFTMFRGSVKSTGLPTPFASFPFTSRPVRHRVPSHFNWTWITSSLPYSRVCAPPKPDISWHKAMLQAETFGQLSVLVIWTATNIVTVLAMWLISAMSTNKVGENSSRYFCCVSLKYNYCLGNICNWKILSVFCLNLNLVSPKNYFFFH